MKNKNKAICILLIVFAFSCNYNKEDTESSATISERWPNGKIKTKKTVSKDNTDYYVVFSYDENEEIESKQGFFRNINHGESVSWYESGVMSDSVIYDMGVPKEIFSYDRNGILIKRAHVFFVDTTVIYAENGKVDRTENYLFSNSETYSHGQRLVEKTVVKNDTMYFYALDSTKQLVLNGYKVKGKVLIEIKK